MDTTILIVTYKSQEAIYNCLDSINKKIPVVIVENSSDQNFKNKLEDKYLNVRCFLTNDNLGFANGNNFGLNLITTKYVFLLNPDTILESDTLDVLIVSAKKIKNFALLAPISSNDLNFGFFNNISKKKIESIQEFFEVDYIKGFAMFFDKNKFINIGFFDPKIFIYFEEIDLCRRLKSINEKIYLIPKAKISHGGGKSHGNIFDIEMELSRNWHYMWSMFYYYNKHFGKITAYKKTLNYFFLSFFKLIFYFFYNKKKYLIYKSRFLGLLNSYFGRRSHYNGEVRSLSLRLSLNVFGIDNNHVSFTPIPLQLQNNSITRISRLESFEIGLIPGYVYVNRIKNWQFSGIMGVGGVIQAKYYSRDGSSRGFLGLAPRFDIHLAGGYSCKSFFVFILTDFDNKSLAFFDLKYSQNFYSIKISGGYRFSQPKKLSKLIN